jgi:TP901 family phage tail tape measure protein
MARSFNLTANLVLAGPTNLRPIVNSIKTALNNISANVDVKINPTVQQDIKNLDRAFKNFNTTLKNTSTVARDAANALRDLDRAVRGVSLKGLNQQMSQASQAAKNVAAASQDAADGMEKFGHVAGLAVRRFAGFALATGVIMGFLGAIKKATSEALSFQDSMVKIAQLTDTNVSGAFQQFGRQITELSTKWGVASNKLADLQRKLVQTGLKAGEMKQVLDALAKTMLAPAFENVDQTLEGTIAMMSQFKIPASEVEKALSSMNVVAAKFAVESQDLITAIRISGGAFATMSRGVSEGRDALNEFMAIFTSVRGSTRESAESIATGLRTIFTRLERPESIFMLKQLGVELLDLEGKFIGPYKAIEKISAAMEKMDPRDTRFAQIAETLGGYRQIGKVLPLLANAEMRIKALQEAKAGETQLTEDATKAQESWNVQLTKTHERFLALIRDITQTDAFKGMMNVILGLANSLIKLGETIKPILPFLGIMAGIKLMGATRSGLSGFFGGIKGKMAGGGMVPGSGSGDTFPAMLEPGEFVIRKNAVKALGAHNLAKINKMHHGGETSRPVIGQVLSLEDVGTKKASNFLAAGLQTATVSNEIRKELIGYIDKAANGMSLGLAKKIGKKLN